MYRPRQRTNEAPGKPVNAAALNGPGMRRKAGFADARVCAWVPPALARGVAQGPAPDRSDQVWDDGDHSRAVLVPVARCLVARRPGTAEDPFCPARSDRVFRGPDHYVRAGVLPHA